MIRIAAFVFLMTLCVFAFGALDVEVRGVAFPASVDVGQMPLVLNGYGLIQKTVFKVDVYAAALYTRTRSTDPQAILHSRDPRRIDVVFLRDVSADDLVNSWIEGFARNRPTSSEDDKLRDLNQHMIDMRKGQRVTLTFADNGLTLSMAGQSPYTIKGRDFAETVLATFIGVPPSESLKRALLGIAD